MTIIQFLDGIRLDLENELVKACPVDTGRLRGSIKVHVKGDELIVKMANYGLFVEFGTAPHIIKPKNKKALRWNKKKGSQVQKSDDIFAKEVKHPGTEAQPFIRNTFYHKLPKIIEVNASRYLPNNQMEVTYG